MKTPIPSIIVRAALAATAFALLGAPSCGHVLEDEGFDLWCGDQLCNWELEDGDIAKVATWHEGDPGVELIGPSVAISQLADRWADGGCLRFEALADVDELAAVTLEIDFYDDGTVDYEARIPTSRWEPVSLLITEARWYYGARFRVRKLGNGRAALAQIEITTSDKCVEPPVDLGPRLDGMQCNDELGCASGICSDATLGICQGCDAGGCGADVCGLTTGAPAFYTLHRACTAPASHVLGERCLGDQECASGVCAAGVCSACASADDCGAGEACVAATTTELIFPFRVCATDGQIASGGFCLGDDQCAGGSCSGSGELRVCQVDGRTCTDDSDCQAIDLGSEPPDNLCVSLGVRDGRCD
jgi:hypothetical protein